MRTVTLAVTLAVLADCAKHEPVPERVRPVQVAEVAPGAMPALYAAWFRGGPPLADAAADWGASTLNTRERR